MNQSMFKKTLLASAISMSYASMNVMAAVPTQLEITGMSFDNVIYNAGGFFNSAGTVGPFDPAVDLALVPGTMSRELASGFDPLTASGNIFSFDNFFGGPWEGEQTTGYLSNQDSWAFVYDKNASPPGDPCSAPVAVTKSSGPCSKQGSYDYDKPISNMTDEQISVGMFFSWNGNTEISVLEILTCDANDDCKGRGVKMQNGPFNGSVAIFNPGLSCRSDFKVTALDTSFALEIATDVFDRCSNPTDPVDPKNPSGLKVDSVESPTAAGGTAIITGGVIDYKPMDGFEGLDEFSVNVSDDTGDTSKVFYEVQVGGQLQNNFTMLDVNGGIIGGTNDVDIVWDEITYNSPTIVPGSDNGDGFGIPAETASVMTIASPTPFRGFNWFAKNVRVYQGPITLKFDIACTEADYLAYDATTNPTAADCATSPLPPINVGERYIKMEIKAGEIGAHMIFDWGKDDPTSTCGLQNCDIDVINVWHEDEAWPDDIRGDGRNELYTGAVGVPPKFDTTWDLISIAKTPGAVIGTPMIDGAFKGSNANFNYNPLEADTANQSFTGTISDTKASLSMNLWALLVGFFSVVGIRRMVSSKVKQQ